MVPDETPVTPPPVVAPVSLGIEEVKAVQIAMNELALEFVKLAKDGIQISDGATLIDDLLTNADLKAKIGLALDGISKVPAELKDLQVNEIVDLVVLQCTYVPQLVTALQK